MSNYEFIKVKNDHQIGYITLNRPEVLNALNRAMIKEIVAAMELFDQHNEVKVIVLSGEGRAFASGADINEMTEDDPITLELLNQFADWDRIALIKKPIIGAIQGFALGGGFELALCCDILLAAENAQFGFPEINIGVMPGAGGTQRLTKLMGKTKALQWLWLGEPMSANEALHYGIVNRLIAPEVLMEETIRLASTISKKPSLSIRFIKESVLKAVDYPLDEGMQYERKNFSLLFSSYDRKEGMKAFIEKRKANFQGR
ncbi:enoyl-CoA hydratase/isomerase family protein [Bacillus aquiflavi]|uniref:Enoyl-CoA hydratase n=1 Tax=Bacillus aquiflavi TaxID=2672567 RepID=A0A6B3W1C2_9BACI|nr:enoyl-CoA hydratase-related protein [Bacillus aquiflavi]MBA4537517.1 enoyl-CoA hydratase/isomerase family protein [Bacillus aquiflavi]NEY81773.1 enoyl-CoA hydratase [Bacillus aquiflavi]